MASAAPAEPPLGPNEQLAIYWDPRYYSYFYAGAMTPPTGQLYDFTGTPIVLPRDTHTWSVVHLEQVDNATAVAARPIILQRDEQGHRKRPRLKRRISWSDVPRPVVVTTAGPAEAGVLPKTRSPAFSRTCSFLCCAAMLIVLLMTLFYLRFFSHDRRRSGTGSAVTLELTTEVHMVVRPFVRKRPSPPPPSPQIEGRILEDSAKAITSEGPHLDAFIDKRGPSREVETRRNICLESRIMRSQERLVCNTGHGSEGSSLCQPCDVFVRCCYSLQGDLVVRPDIREQISAINSTAATWSASVLLGVRAGYAVLKRLASHEGRVKFARHALDAVKGGEFDGIRLWLPWPEEQADSFHDLVSALATDVAPRLRRKKYTFGFILPVEIARNRSVASELKNTLNAPHGLLLYFDFLALWNPAADEWPSPRQLLARVSRKAELSNDDFVCYFIAWPTALSAHKIQEAPRRGQSASLFGERGSRHSCHFSVFASFPMASAAPAEAPLGPNEQLVIYWDPRYYSYFYAGAMTPPTGQLYDFTGTPIVLPRDTHTWSVVHLEQVDNATAVAARPIILQRDEQVGEVRLPKGYFPQSPLVVTAAGPAEAGVFPKTRSSAFSRTCSLLCCAAVLVVLLVTLFYLRLFSHDRRRSGTCSAVTLELTTEVHMVVGPFVRKRVSPPPPSPQIGGRILENSAKAITSEGPHLDAFIDKRGPSCEVETRRNICLVSRPMRSQEPLVCNTGHGSEGSSLCQHCDVFVRCCYSLQGDLVVRPDIREEISATNSTPATLSASGLLGVRAGYAVLKRLASHEGRVKFARHALDAVKGGEFDGNRLWLPWPERRLDYVISELKNTLNAPHSVLLYLDFLALWNPAADEWPSPRQLLDRVSRKAELSNDDFLCYFIASPRALSAHVRGRCQHRNVGGAVETPSAAIIALPQLCKILDERAFDKRKQKYYTCACNEGGTQLYHCTAAEIASTSGFVTGVSQHVGDITYEIIGPDDDSPRGANDTYAAEVSLIPPEVAMEDDPAAIDTETAESTAATTVLEESSSTLASATVLEGTTLGPFSTVVEPLLNGFDLTESEHRRQSRQLRHEIIYFLEYVL
ncbi:hypothetical protein HPB50_028131 [Hyalomma asiaticum]|nr:hypothetical protein HPB50_028131 [Hyalomma asiaticum]